MPKAARERVTSPRAGAALAPFQGVSSRRTSLDERDGAPSSRRADIVNCCHDIDDFPLIPQYFSPCGFLQAWSGRGAFVRTNESLSPPRQCAGATHGAFAAQFRYLKAIRSVRLSVAAPFFKGSFAAFELC